MTTPQVAAAESVWSVSVHPPVQGNAAWRARLAERLQPLIEGRLRTHPSSREFSFCDELLSISVHQAAGAWKPGDAIRLRFNDVGAAPSQSSAKSETSSISSRALPDPDLEVCGSELVGLEEIASAVLLQLHCRWGGQIDVWSNATGQAVPPPLFNHLVSSPAAFTFWGDPGTGKSSLAMAIGDRYCRECDEEGELLLLSTAQARGNGLVGDMGRQITGAFEWAHRAATRGPVFLVIDEGDVIAGARDRSECHKEDLAGTAALIQALDSLAGTKVAVFLTTNIPASIDPAVRRRTREFHFPRTRASTRRSLLDRWLPMAGDAWLDEAVTASEGTTPADLVKVLTDCYLKAIRQGLRVEPGDVLEELGHCSRTGSLL